MALFIVMTMVVYAGLISVLREQKRRKEHYGRCRESYLIRARKRYAEKREQCLTQQREYIKKNREVIALRNRERATKTRPRINEYRKAYFAKKYRQDPQFRLAVILRGRMDVALRKKVQSQKTLSLLGCSIRQLRKHLEWQFKPGMSWDNAGEWHIDHIRPCVSFDLTDPIQQNQCFNYTNLQPLWAVDNLKKGASY